MKIKDILAGILFLLSLTALGQAEVGLKLNGGVSMINETYDHFMRFNLRPTAQGGAYFDIPLSKRSHFGFELLYAHIQGAGYRYYPEEMVYRYSLRVNSISLPLYYSFKMNRLSLQAGLQVNVLTGSRIIGTTEVDGYVQYGILRKYFDMLYNVGLRAGAIYAVSDRLSLEANYFVGEVRSYRYYSIYNYRVYQWNLGVRYALIAARK